MPELLRQPLRVIVAGRPGSTGSLEVGKSLFALANTEKDLFVVEGAGHYDRYSRPAYVDQAIAWLAPFYRDHLAYDGCDAASPNAEA